MDTIFSSIDSALDQQISEELESSSSEFFLSRTMLHQGVLTVLDLEGRPVPGMFRLFDD
jgi:hypothetical protein